jgi:hypothetical protein
MLIHLQNSHAPRGRRCTGRHEAQSRELVMRVKKRLCIYLWLYSPLLGLGRFLQVVALFTQSVGLLGRGSARHKAAT